MARFHLEEAIAILERTPRALDALLRGVPDAWVRANEGGDSWNAFDVVGHLVAGERTDWIPRVRILIEHGESRAFDPFDRFAMKSASLGKSMEDLLDEFADLRLESIEALDAFDLVAVDLARTGRHPDFGVVTLEQLLATWVVHDLGHVRQIARAMAKRYAAEVGPWVAYLPVLGE